MPTPDAVAFPRRPTLTRLAGRAAGATAKV